MNQRKPRLIATLSRELRAGQFAHERAGIDTSQMVAEGIVALGYVSDADRAAIKDWAKLLSAGQLTWGEFQENLEKSRDHQGDEIERLMAELSQRLHEKPDERQG